jgi:hypothetical protein
MDQRTYSGLVVVTAGSLNNHAPSPVAALRPLTPPPQPKLVRIHRSPPDEWLGLPGQL